MYVTAFEFVTVMLLPVCAWVSFKFGHQQGVIDTIEELEERGILEFEEKD